MAIRDGSGSGDRLLRGDHERAKGKVEAAAGQGGQSADKICAGRAGTETCGEEEMNGTKLENRLTDSYLLGIAVGYEQAAGYLVAESGRLFANKQDEKAKLNRDLADTFSILALEARKAQKKHAQDHPWE